MKRLLTATALLITQAHVTPWAQFATSAEGQAAGFVLFGEADAEGQSQEASTKFVHPVTSPYYHEDSFVTSDLRAWFLHHEVEESSTLGGGDIQIAALQVRLALTDSIQFVAYKDGYSSFDTPVIDKDGWNDVAAGIKWQFFRDWEQQLFAAAGIGYQFAFGNSDVLQSDEELRLWASVNKGFGKLHLGATTNLFFRTGDESATFGTADSRFFWHLHGDYYINEWLSPVVEFNGYHTLEDGDTAPLPESAVDAAILGGGNSVVTLGLGAEVRPIPELPIRIAYEAPITSGDDIYDYRVTASVIYSF